MYMQLLAPLALDIAMSGERKQVSGPGAEPGQDGAGAAAYIEYGAMLGLGRHRPRDPRGRVTTPWPCDQCVQAAEPCGGFLKH